MSGCSYEQLLVYCNAMGPAVIQVVVHKPEDVQRLQKIVLIVIKLKRAVEPENGLHALVRDQGVGRAGTFLHIASCPGHPVILQISPTALQCISKNPAAMAMPA